MEVDRKKMLDTVKTLHDYAQFLKSYEGNEHINEWGSHMGGEKFPKPVVCFNTRITRDTCKKLVDAMGDINPLYRDGDYTRNTKYGTIIAPPTWPFSIAYGEYPEFKHPDFNAEYQYDELEWFLPAAEGDNVNFRAVYPCCVEEKDDEILACGYYEFLRRQGGEPMCRQKFSIRYTKKTGDEPKPEPLTVPEYEESYIADVRKAWEKENEDFRGKEIRWFEDVNEGDALTTFVRGPLSVMETASWVNAASPYIFCSDKIHRYIHEETGLGHYDTDLNMWLNEHENEYDAYGKLTERTGAAPAGGFGSQRCGWIITMISNWMSDEGFLWKLKVNHIKHSNEFYNTYWSNAKVTAKHKDGTSCWVDISFDCVDRYGEKVLCGEASVMLPSKELGNVIYPAPETPFKTICAK